MSPPTSSSTSPVNTAGLESNSNNNHHEGGDNGEMIESLGAALAGVNIGGGQATTSDAASIGSGVGELFPPHSSNNHGSTSPFSSMGGAGTGAASVPDHNKPAEIDWTTAAFSSGNAGAPAPQDGQQEQSQGVKESLDRFLSQDPSHTLGDDVFKLSSTNLPALALSSESDRRSNGDTSPFSFNSGHHGNSGGLATGMPSSNGVFGEIRPAQEPSSNRARRTDSPSCSVTGTATSSRSASPYVASASHSDSQRGGIPAYRYDNSVAGTPTPRGDYIRRQASYAEVEDRQSHGGHGGSAMSRPHGSHPNIPSLNGNGQHQQHNLLSSVGSSSPYEKDLNYTAQREQSAPPQINTAASLASPQQPQQLQQQGQQPQPQVLYMAVPAPDGRGQVLQPVQMVQVQGKPYTYVVPQGNTMDGNQMAMLPPLNAATENNMNGPGMNGGGGGMMRTEQRNPMTDHRNRNYAMDGGPKDEYGMLKAGGKYQPNDNNNIDPAASSLYSTTQRPPLDALLGQVRRLSRDQVGCRLVQQALDEEGPMTATLILNEGLPFWSEAMVDPFGNYLFQKILEKITAEERIMLVKTVSSRLVNASLNLHGTRSVQKIVELCAQDEERGAAKLEGNEESAADVLTRSLFPAAARLCIDSHGNHVIQRILLKLGPKHTKFVFDAVAASVGDVARHRHGCCVIQRCLDSPVSEARSHLVYRIVEKSLELMQDAYGNYVVQYVLDVCSDEDVHAVCESVVGKVSLLAIQKFSSNVMEKCLERCTDSVKEMYMQELSDPERIRELMMDPFGNYVVQRALSVATHSQAVRLVEAMKPHLISTQTGFAQNGVGGQRTGGIRNTAGGRRIMAKICRRFPNFTLSAVGPQEELFSQNKSHRHHHQHNGGGGHNDYATQGHAMSPFAPMAGGPRMGMQHQQPHYTDYNGDLGPIGGAHLAMNQQQAYYDEAGNVGYFDHNFSGQNYNGQNFSFPNM